jgi:hypothetical protein
MVLPLRKSGKQIHQRLILRRLEENIGSVNVELTADDLRGLDAAASKIAVQGARYPEQLQKMVNR